MTRLFWDREHTILAVFTKAFNNPPSLSACFHSLRFLCMYLLTSSPNTRRIFTRAQKPSSSQIKQKFIISRGYDGMALSLSALVRTFIVRAGNKSVHRGLGNEEDSRRNQSLWSANLLLLIIFFQFPKVPGTLFSIFTAHPSNPQAVYMKNYGSVKTIIIMSHSLGP